MDLGEAADVFIKLSVGDGLVTQIPALIVSLAAGLLVSKGGTRGSADKAVFGQLGAYPRALYVAAGAAHAAVADARPADASLRGARPARMAVVGYFIPLPAEPPRRRRGGDQEAGCASKDDDEKNSVKAVARRPPRSNC